MLKLSMVQHKHIIKNSNRPLHGLFLSIFLAFLCTTNFTAPVMAFHELSHAEAEAAVRMRNFQRAAQLYEDLAEAGDQDAQYTLGNLYRSGRGVEQRNALSQRFLWGQIRHQR